MDTTTETKELVFDDVEFEGGAELPERETIPEDTYQAVLVGFRSDVDKPDWKQQQELANLVRKNPDATLADVDPKQYEFVFEISAGEYAGTRLAQYANRTFHEKSTAGKIAAALMGMDTFMRSVLQAQGGTRILKGKPCRIDVVEKATKRDPNELRNYIQDVKRIPPKRNRETTQKPATGRVQLDGFPTDQDEIAFDETVD